VNGTSLTFDSAYSLGTSGLSATSNGSCTKD
jgi:hypothetical protein